MFLVLYSHTLIAFYLPLSSRSFILIMIFMIFMNSFSFQLMFKMFLVRYQFAISSQAPIIWNEIPLSIRNSLTTTNFI